MRALYLDLSLPDVGAGVRFYTQGLGVPPQQVSSVRAEWVFAASGVQVVVRSDTLVPSPMLRER